MTVAMTRARKAPCRYVRTSAPAVAALRSLSLQPRGDAMQSCWSPEHAGYGDAFPTRARPSLVYRVRAVYMNEVDATNICNNAHVGGSIGEIHKLPCGRRVVCKNGGGRK